MSVGTVEPEQSEVEALLAAYRRCADPAYRLALSITRDPAAAEDVVQEAFCRVQQRSGQLEDVHALDGYLYRTARNLAFDRRRALKKSPVVEPREVALVDCPAGGAEAEEEAARLSAALLELPDEQREVVLLRVHGGHTFARIAELTGAPLGTVHSRFRYAMQRLRGLLEVGHD